MMTDMSEAETAAIQSEIDKTDSEEAASFSDAANKLTIGVLNFYQPPLEEVKKELNELTTKQEVLLNQMHLENRKLSETSEDLDLNEMFATVRVYQNKLALIKKEMFSIHERTFRLKKRALRLQQIKQKEALSREQQREQEIRREQDLIGKPSTQ